MLIAAVADVARIRRYSACRRTDWIDIAGSNVITTASNAAMPEILSAMRRLSSPFTRSPQNFLILPASAGCRGFVCGVACIGRLGFAADITDTPDRATGSLNLPSVV